MNCTTLFLATLRSDTGKENAINGSVSSVCLQNVLVTPDRQRTLEWLDTTDVLPESSGLFATHRGALQTHEPRLRTGYGGGVVDGARIRTIFIRAPY